MKSLTPSLAAAALILAIGLLAGACEKLPNVPPTAGFIYSPVAPIVAGQTAVLFNASSSTDSDGNISSYVWDFGDGSGQVTKGDPVTTHVFTGNACVPSLRQSNSLLTATYAVSLTVVDNAGAHGASSQNVTVTCP